MAQRQNGVTAQRGRRSEEEIGRWGKEYTEKIKEIMNILVINSLCYSPSLLRKERASG
jgi:hypothetical protein